MLVYFDPWMAGVVLPTMIIIGLIALPYIDFNPKGNGYYTFAERKFAVTVFLFGFVVLWVTLIVLGTFLRGPNWNFFGPFERWDPHKNVPLNNVNLSEIFWRDMHGPGHGRRCRGSARTARHLFVAGYMLAVAAAAGQDDSAAVFHQDGLHPLFPAGDADSVHGRAAHQDGAAWTMNLKYIVFIPEAFFNI